MNERDWMKKKVRRGGIGFRSMNVEGGRGKDEKVSYEWVSCLFGCVEMLGVDE